MATNVKPLYDRILVKRLESEQKTAAGIIIPDTAQEKTQMGEIVAAGDGRLDKDGKKTPLSVKAGDTVLFGKFSGTDVKVGADEMLILREDEVLGIIEK